MSHEWHMESGRSFQNVYSDNLNLPFPEPVCTTSLYQHLDVLSQIAPMPFGQFLSNSIWKASFNPTEQIRISQADAK